MRYRRCSAVEQLGARHPHKVEVAGSTPARATEEMRLVLNIPRNPNRRLWEEHMMVDALVSGTPTHYVCASEQQAKQTFESAIALLNGRDPKATPG